MNGMLCVPASVHVLCVIAGIGVEITVQACVTKCAMHFATNRSSLASRTFACKAVPHPQHNNLEHYRVLFLTICTQLAVEASALCCN